MNNQTSSSAKWRRIRAFCDVGGSDDPWQATIRISELIRSKSGQREPPFNARLYCESFGVGVEDQWLIDCDARLLPTRNGFVAEIQADHSAARKQFSICHELAHVFFTCEKGPAEISSGDESPEYLLEERLCDRVAVELLMPSDVFSIHATHLPVEFASVKKLANTFNVSLQAAMKRVVELNIWACGYVNYETSRAGALNLRHWRVSDIWRDGSRSSYSANRLGDAIRSAGTGLRRLVLSQTTRSVQVEWYSFGVRSKFPLVCAFLSAVPIKPPIPVDALDPIG